MFDKGPRKHNGESIVSLTNVWKLGILMQKDEIGPLSYAIHKIKLRFLNERPKTLQLLRKWKTFSILILLMISWVAQEAQATKAKIDRRYSVRLKSFEQKCKQRCRS